MFPEELMQVIVKYKSKNQEQIKNIYRNLCEIITALKGIQQNMATDLFDIYMSDDINDTTELNADIKVLKEQIAYIKSFTNSQQHSNNEDSINIDKKVTVWLVNDDLCPICGTKLEPYKIYYKRYNATDSNNVSVNWYECPNCHKLYCIDCDIENFDFENTNIVLKDTYYKQVTFNDVIVLSTVRSCVSKEHDLIDMVAKIPVVTIYGKITFVDVPIAYCKQCCKYIMLKNDFNNINGIIACQIIDKTVNSNQQSNDEIDIKQRESILYQYGYNVKSNSNLSSKQRHIILSMVVESDIMTREQICSHLDTLIERGSKISSWKTATEKWVEDRYYITRYNAENLPQEIFNRVILKYSKTKKSE